VFGARAVTEVQRLAFAAEEFQQLYDRWPSHAELLAADPTLPHTDIWRHDFGFALTDGSFTVQSAGVDGILRTGDDVVSTPIHATK